MGAIVEAKGIKKSYGTLQVLKGLDLSVSKGEVVAIVGPSGAGKSTLLHILGALDSPDSGEFLFGNHLLNNFKAQQLASFRNEKIGFVFQFHNLLPEFNALENICLPGFIKGENENEVKKRADELLSILNISDRKNHKPSELSGGEQQRVAVARALINKPELVLADEPSGNLDTKHANELHQLFFDLRDNYGYTFVIVTHNESLAEMADRKVVLKDGLIVTS